MTIVVDTNIVFSAILNTGSLIGDLILNSDQKFRFLSCQYLFEEINTHWQKLKKVSKLTESELLESQRLIYKNIQFIHEGQIPVENRRRAYEIVKEIDMKDIVFVALADFQQSLLWTGDKTLIKGLKSHGFDSVITTEGMVELRNHIDSES